MWYDPCVESNSLPDHCEPGRSPFTFFKDRGGEWHHLVLAHEDGCLRLWIDGVKL